MKRRWIAVAAALVLGTVGMAAEADAAVKLYYSERGTSSGFDLDDYGRFSMAVKEVFGEENIFELTTFDNASSFADAGAIIVNIRLGSSALSAQEQTNLLNAINAGKALLFVGDHASWETWDNSFLNLFGDSFKQRTSLIQMAYKVGDHPIHADNRIHLSSTGTITGGNGTTVYATHLDEPMAALYGPNNNALAFLDSGVFSGSPAALGENQRFFANLAQWMHDTATIPEPASLVLMGVGGALLLSRRRA